MKINPLLSGTLLFFPLLLMSWVPRSNEDSLCIDNVLVPIIVQTLSIGTRGPALCVNAYCQFFQKVGTNFMQTYLHWYNASPRRRLALSMQIVNFLIEFLWALYCFLDFTERDLHW